MATTYDRIRAVLEEVKRNERGGSKTRGYHDLAEYLANRQIKEFLIDREQERFLSAGAIRRLLRLLSDMKLIEFTGEDQLVVLAAGGRQALRGDNYNRMVSHAALEFLGGYNITLQSILQTISSVKLPDVPEAETIYAKLPGSRKEELGYDRFRMILYLLYWTERLSRDVKVLYGKRGA